jgi:Fur family transcriptional regulator, zinc uptake regulator
MVQNVSGAPEGSAQSMPSRETANLFPAPGHNHGTCLHAAVDRAERAFDTKGLKLTALRRKVLHEIAGSHQAVGAYDILDKLARKGDRLAPISVYRAIDALLAAGVVHRLESRNAFFACHASHAGAANQVILACETCGLVAEVNSDAIFQSLTKAAESANFKPQRRVVEMTGLCGHCQLSAAEASNSGIKP